MPSFTIDRPRGEQVTRIVCLFAAFTLTGCMAVPQTYDPGITGRILPKRRFIPSDYRDNDLAAVRPPFVQVQVEDTSGELLVELCSHDWDYRRIRILDDQSSLTDKEGHSYRLAPLRSNDYANRTIGASRFIQYFTSASGPMPSKSRHSDYGSPHKLRIAYVEDGRRYVAEREFAAVYPIVTFFDFVSRSSQEP